MAFLVSLLGSATLIAVLALRAQAQDAPPALTPAEQELLRKYDTNGDGRLDDSEKAAAHAQMRQQDQTDDDRRPGKRLLVFLQRFDRNKDGKLDANEKTALKNFLEERQKDGDSRIAGIRENILKRISQPEDIDLNALEKRLADAKAGGKAK